MRPNAGRLHLSVLALQLLQHPLDDHQAQLRGVGAVLRELVVYPHQLLDVLHLHLLHEVLDESLPEHELGGDQSLEFAGLLLAEGCSHALYGLVDELAVARLPLDAQKLVVLEEGGQVVGTLELDLRLEVLEQTFFGDLDQIGPLPHHLEPRLQRDGLVLDLYPAAEGEQADEIADEVVVPLSKLHYL